jgi:hypothetical protein
MLNTTRKGQARRWLAAASVASVAAAAMVAHAADPMPVPGQNGLMTFPNVRVVAMPPPAATPSAVRTPPFQGGFKAFIDPATGELVEPTAEEAAALEAAGAANAGQTGVFALQQSPTVTMTSPYGGVGARLDESHMSYFVARRNADGALGMACVPGEQAAQWLSKGNGASTNTSVGKGEPK